MPADPRDRDRDDDLAELERASQQHLECDRELSMSERLAALHELCKQAAAIGPPAGG